jgi:hypothetical protein
MESNMPGILGQHPVASSIERPPVKEKGLGFLQALDFNEDSVVGADGVEPPTYAL